MIWAIEVYSYRVFLQLGCVLAKVERAKREQVVEAGMGMLHVFVLLLSCVNILFYLISHPSEYILLILSLFVVDNARTM